MPVAYPSKKYCLKQHDLVRRVIAGAIYVKKAIKKEEAGT
ncbi:hypothetical protein J2S74_005091 [Evansella vedderi]|uniref:Uncharacterized protein n=1 Tax=Evansella vedderi TaxID=38282 RepID=A0ABU0A2A6_9BACI|nr:hypothetical protein [Evansella vedderi]